MIPVCLARLAPVLLAGLLAAACATAPPAPPAVPRLVVVIVLDGLPQRQVTDYLDQFGRDGLRRFLDRGAWFPEARFPYANTLTGPGHATILTGASPAASGIIANEWLDPDTGAPVYCAGDPAHRYLGQGATGIAGTSPRNLLAQTLGEVLVRADPRSKVVAVSGKDRGAILLAGRAGAAYVFVPRTGEFSSTTYYMPSHPAWVTAFNAAKPADRHFRAVWSPLLPEMAYGRSVPDGQPWFASGGKLPMTIGEALEAPGPAFYASLYRSPFLDALTLDFARAAIAGEGLGADEAPDLLAVSLSSHDYVNHAWGAESRLSHDHVLQVDELLARLFRDLDHAIGRDAYVAVLTADHGFMPVPEFLAGQGRDAGRLDARATLARVEAALAAKFGAGPWLRGWSAQGLLFDRALANARGVDANALAALARRSLLAEPGIEAVHTRAGIEGGDDAAAPWIAEVRRGWHRERSPDLQVIMKPGWMLTTYRTGTTHGSPHDYDARVPILAWGPRWVKPGRRDGPASVTDIAPSLAAMLGLAAPSSSEGRALPLAP
ncbi:MAG: alkaline phosphatase family protein [Burkholderiales bacterium]